MENNKTLNDEAIDLVNGGVLPEGWEQKADALAPMLRRQYPNATYEEACEKLAEYIDDPEDLAQVRVYIRKYF